MNYCRILLKLGIGLLVLGNVLYGQDSYTMNLAKSLEKSYRYEEALDVYTRLYRQYPANTNVINGMINCYKKLLRFNDLIGFLEQNIKTNPNNSRYLAIELGEAYFLKEDKERALAVWDSVINIRKNDISLYRIIGTKLVSLQAYKEAISLYRKAVQANPDQVIFQLEIGTLYQALMQYDLATRHYLAYYHQNVKIKGHIERQIMKMADKSEAVIAVSAEIKQYLMQNPGNMEIREMLAGIYLKNKMYDEALAQYKMLENDKSQGIYYLKYAQEAVNNEAWSRGIDAYLELLRKYPESPLKDQVNYELAENYAAAALREGGDNGEAYMQKAVSLFEILSKKTSLVPGRNSLIKLGDIYRTYFYDLDNAIAHYMKFLELLPLGANADAVRILLGDTYLMKGDLAAAEQIYRSVRQPAHIYTALFRMADLDYYRGNFVKSIESCDKIIKNAGMANDLTNNALQRKLFISSFRGDSLALYTYASAELLLYRHNWREAAQLFLELAKRNNPIRYKSGLEAGRLFMNHEQYDDARTVFQLVMQNDSTGVYSEETAYLQACNEELSGNLTQALEWYQDYLVRFPNSIFVNTVRKNARNLNERLNNDQI